MDAARSAAAGTRTEHAAIVEWCGEEFDPEEFDADETTSP